MRTPPRTRRTRAARRDQDRGYAAAVAEALTPYFPDLSQPHIAGMLRDAVARHADAPDPAFEFLLDTAGNWRLRAADEPGRVRVACFRVPPQADADTARECELNQLLPRRA